AERIYEPGRGNIGKANISRRLGVQRFRPSGKHAALYRAGLQRGENLRARAGLKYGDVFVGLQVPFLQHVARDEVGRGADTTYAESCSFQLIHFFDAANRPKLEWQRIDSGAEQDHVGALQVCRDGRATGSK